MDKRLIAKELNKKVEVVNASFDNYGLTVVSYGFCRIDEETGWLDLLVEIEEDPGFDLEQDLQLKVTLYDKDGDIIFSDSECIYEEDFDGYDTIRFHLTEDDLAFHVARCRIFMTKG